MPLTNPPSVDIIYPELNTPPAGPAAGSQELDFDTFYDINLDDITATKTAALARMGLSYAAGIFTALRPGVWGVTWEYNIDASPGGACDLQFIATDYLGYPTQLVANPNTLGFIRSETKVLALPLGGTFNWQQTCTNSGDTPLSYMDAAITRLV